MIAKALASEADAIIIDLEDAVAPERKAQARRDTAELLPGAMTSGKTVFVRINGLREGFLDEDLAAVMPHQPHGLVLPKCVGMRDVDALSHHLDQAEAGNAGARRTLILPVATESAAALLALPTFVGQANARLWGLLWGAEDLAADVGATSNRHSSGAYRAPFDHARTQCLFAAHAAGVVAVDAVFTDFRDMDGLAAETEVGLADGFGAKAAIHPAQVAVINRAFTPSPERIAWAHTVIELLAERGAAQLDGRMIDIAHLRAARRILQRADLLAGISPGNVPGDNPQFRGCREATAPGGLPRLC